MPFYHPDTKALLDAFRQSDAHAAVLVGKEGIGLNTALGVLLDGKKARYIVLPEKDEKVDLEKGSITIQSIRRLYDLTKTREPGGRVIVIDYAERMGIPAQNAFLKLLEEPVAGTRFVLLTHDTSSLLPTILSRAQRIPIKPISAEQSAQLLDELKVTDPTKRAQLLFIASGYPASLTRLASDDKLFAERAQIVKDARTFIMGSPYQRLLIAAGYKNDRQKALTLLEDASKLLQRSLSENPGQGTLSALRKLETVHKRIFEQGNVRLQLSSAVLL
jgi:hypothetical protein